MAKIKAEYGAMISAADRLRNSAKNVSSMYDEVTRILKNMPLSTNYYRGVQGKMLLQSESIQQTGKKLETAAGAVEQIVSMYKAADLAAANGTAVAYAKANANILGGMAGLFDDKSWLEKVAGIVNGKMTISKMNGMAILGGLALASPALTLMGLYGLVDDNKRYVNSEGKIKLPNGDFDGKSTLLRCINQLEKADGGEINVDDVNMFHTENGKAVYAPSKTLRDIRLKIGLVFQNFNLFPHFSVNQNIMEAPLHVLKQPKAEAKANCEELLKKMGLETKGKSYPCELSGGQQQRVSIARALALKPQILFFDEPTSALDPELTGEILKVIKELAKEKMTMVIVTHEMAFARDVANHVIFMDDGYIVEEGTPEEVFGQTQNERTKQFLQRFNDR